MEIIISHSGQIEDFEHVFIELNTFTLHGTVSHVKFGYLAFEAVTLQGWVDAKVHQVARVGHILTFGEVPICAIV